MLDFPLPCLITTDQSKAFPNSRLKIGLEYVRIGFGICLGSGFWFSFLVPFALYLQQFGAGIRHFASYLIILAWSLCILHGLRYSWPCSPSILHLRFHSGFHDGSLYCFFRVSSRVSYQFLRVSLGFTYSFTMSCKIQKGENEAK